MELANLPNNCASDSEALSIRSTDQIELKWSDVENKSVIVRRAKVENEVKETKTYKAREIFLNDRALKALLRQEKFKKSDSEYIFHNPVTNLQWHDEKSQNEIYWKPTLKNLRLETVFLIKHAIRLQQYCWLKELNQCGYLSKWVT